MCIVGLNFATLALMEPQTELSVHTGARPTVLAQFEAEAAFRRHMAR